MKNRKDDSGERGLYAHHDRGYGRHAGGGYGPGAYGYEGAGTRRLNPTVEDDYSDSYGYGSRFGESPVAKHGLGWADDRNELPSTGRSFKIEDPGQHRGKGPKNWKRSDELIHDEVCHALLVAPDVDASDIEVSVTEGQVTLAGTVPDRVSRRRADDVIHDMPGVQQVFNHLKIRPN
jgi:hypothetical protein